MEVKPLETIIIAPLCESTNPSDSVTAASNAQSNNMLTESGTNQYRQQKNEESNQNESTLVDLKTAPIDTTNFQCHTESDEYQGFDQDLNFDDASNHSECVQTVPNQLEQQRSEEIKPNRQQMKGKNKVTNKTKPTKEKVTKSTMHACDKCDRTFSSPKTLKKHQLMHSSQRPFPCPLCSKS